MAVPVRRNPLDVPSLDPFAQLDRVQSQLGTLLDTWGPLPELPHHRLRAPS
jgi:hypothetical protein